MAPARNRSIQFLLITGVVVLGLASRGTLSAGLPDFVTRYAGDTLWALMAYLGVGFLFPRMAPLRAGFIGLGLSFAIELSQLYQADWLNVIRTTGLGALVLGRRFLWSDLACYFVGCALGVLGEKGLARTRTFFAREKPLVSP